MMTVIYEQTVHIIIRMTKSYNFALK